SAMSLREPEILLKAGVAEFLENSFEVSYGREVHGELALLCTEFDRYSGVEPIAKSFCNVVQLNLHIARSRFLTRIRFRLRARSRFGSAYREPFVHNLVGE